MTELYRIRQCQKSWAVDEHGRIAGGTREQMLALVEQWNAHNLKLDILPGDLSYEVVLDPLDERVQLFGAQPPQSSTDLRPYKSGDRVWVSFPRDDKRLRGVVVGPRGYDEYTEVGYTRVICENKGGRPIIVPDRRVAMRDESEDFPKDEAKLGPYKTGDRVWVAFNDNTLRRGVVIDPKGAVYEYASPGYTRVLCENNLGAPVIVPDRYLSLRDEPEDFPAPAAKSATSCAPELAVVWIVEQLLQYGLSYGGTQWVQIGICRTEPEALELRKRNDVGLESATHYNGRHRAADALVYGDRLVLVDVQKFETFEKAAAQ